MIRPTTPSNPSQFSTPPRSTTLPAKPAHKHHISHHPHHHHHHHRHHHDKSVPQSAVLPTTSNPFGEFLSKTNSRIDGRPNGNSTPPRGPEQQQQQQQQQSKGNERAHELKDTERDGERETWKEVERMRARRNVADEDLRSRLAKLATLSNVTTRRLDYTYYSILSSVSSLTSAISSLSSLSAQTAGLQTHFASSSSSLAAEIAAQISSSDGSVEQARRISRLEERVRKGRERVGRLGEKLDGVREKVERSSLRDRESRRTTGRRLKMLWGTLGFLIGLFLILAATRQLRRNDNATRDRVVRSDGRMEDVFEEVLGTRLESWEQRLEMAQRDNEDERTTAKTDVNRKITAARTSAVDADATLQLFDEL